MKKYALIFSCLITGTLSAQVNTNQFGTNQIEGSNQIAVGTYTEYENQPYVSADWSKGILLAADGKRYMVQKLNYNAYNDRPEYQEQEKTFQPRFEVKAFVLGDTITGAKYRKGFAAIDQQSPKSFYEVLVDRQVKLLKYTKANLLDVTSFNSATRQKKFDFNTMYYLVKPDQSIVRIKKDKKSILEALPEQAERIEEIAKERKSKMKSWEDIQQVLAEL
ncbi:hypothetical protein BWI96_03375 [Siphonobacter sp. SORGH_AS_0500]|uniref:hypothetical protein n=1 Tax=Siphonobacter sp. SORGH_AS_0500 TaxID=1864824 RepID=UPI000CC597DA|nr:hypothetical protein [Siphonobacter sp. SORGH_AS_0500]PKK38131.1 hypothetical protein BWI96_03375 [Siphonobacter sp. SORGH_AS_0500]